MLGSPIVTYTYSPWEEVYSCGDGSFENLATRVQNQIQAKSRTALFTCVRCPGGQRESLDIFLVTTILCLADNMNFYPV